MLECTAQAFHPAPLAGFSSARLLAEAAKSTTKFFDSICVSRHIPGNTEFVSYGASPDGVFMLVDGTATVIDSRGDELAPLSPGNLAGLLEIVAEQPAAAGLRTKTDCRFEFVTKDDLVLFLRTEPDICFRLAVILSEDLHEIYGDLAN